MVELALVALPYFFIIFIIIETGLFILSYHAVTLAAHEGARSAAVRDVTEADIRDVTAAAIQTRARNLGLLLKSTPNVEVLSVSDEDGPRVCVTVSYRYLPILNLLGAFDLKAKSCMPRLKNT